MKQKRQMIRKLFFLCAVNAVLLQSCAKKNSGAQPDTVIINGTTYPTVVIGGQTWTAENYSGPGGGEVQATSSYGLANGNYYNAFNISLPPGWRIPNVGDFNNLLLAYKGHTDGFDNYQVSPANTNALESVNGWITMTGTNSSGFNALPSGAIADAPTLANLADKGSIAVFLSTTIYEDNQVFVLFIDNTPVSDGTFTYSTAITLFPYAANQTEDYCSVRFVKDN